MRQPIDRLARVLISIAVAGLLLPAHGEEAKADRKKSQAAYQRAVRAEEAGRRDEALAAYTEAVQTDPSNGAAWRGRAKAYLAAGLRDKAGADLDEAIKIQPGDAQSYAARGEFFSATNQPQRAIQDFDTAISLKLERSDDLHRTRQRLPRHGGVCQSHRRFRAGHQAPARQPRTLSRPRAGPCGAGPIQRCAGRFRSVPGAQSGLRGGLRRPCPGVRRRCAISSAPSRT